MSYDDTWDNIHAEREWGTCPEPLMARFAKRHLRVGARVLDVGCGVGAQTFWLHDNGYSVEGIDPSVKAIERAVGRRTARGAHDLPRFACTEAASAHCRYPSSHFDGIVDVCTLQHVGALCIDSAIKSLVNVLKPLGWLFSMTASTGHKADDSGTFRRNSNFEEAMAPYVRAGLQNFTIDMRSITDNGRGPGRVFEHFVITCQKPGPT